MKTALVTGGNRGIGRAIAAGLVRDHRGVIGVRDRQAGREAAEALGCGWVHLDLEAPEGFAPALERIGGIDVLVNNAGILIDSNMNADPQGVARTMQVMFHAPYELIRLCLPHMAARGWGRIVNLSSDWGSFSEGLAGPGAYGVAKAALNALTHALPRDLPEGVKVNAMCPGWVATRMGGEAAPRSPAQGAETALWLARLGAEGPTGGFFRDKKELGW